MTSIEGSARSRRQLFRDAGVVAAAVVAAQLPLGRASAQRSAGPLTLAGVLPHVGSRFDVWVTPLERERFTLLEAVARPPRSLGRREVTGEAFSLLFSGGRRRVPPGTYTFAHAHLGTFTLLVGPVGRGVNGQRYEAVVNHHALVP